MALNNAKQLLLVILTLVAVVLTVTHSALSASSLMVSQELMQKATRESEVRVIVRLAVSENGVSPFDSDILRELRRVNITQAQNSVRASLLGVAHRIHHQYRDLPFIVLQLGRDGLQTLDSLQGVVSEVLEDRLLRPSLAESVPIVQANQVWTGAFKGVPYDGSGTVVAILDSGVDKNHPFLGNVIEEACFSSNYAPDSATSVCPGGAASSFATGSGLPCNLAISGCNHGTHVAGIATGNGRNGTVASFSGVAKGANVMAVQVFSRFDNSSICGSAAPCILAYTSDIMAGLQRVYDLRGSYNFASINMSLGGDGFTTFCDSDPTKPIIDLLRAANIATVIAAGNNGFTNKISAPGCISSAVSIGSTGDGSGGFTQDAVSSFSNSASFLSLLAPGELINSSVPGTGFANFRGTSMATPHVAGAFALIKQAMPTLTVSQALTALQNSGLGVLDTRNNITKPRIRVLNALLSLDTTPPNTLITGSPLDLTNLTSANFTFTSTEANSTFACKLDAGTFASCTSPKSYTGLAAGSHTFQVQATDASNNTDPTPASFTWAVDTTMPDTSISSGPTGSITVNSATFNWTGSDNVTALANLLYAYRLDPLEPSFSAFGTATTKTYTGLANGNYTFIVKSKDQAGNEDTTPASQGFAVNVPAATPTIGLSFDGQSADRVGQAEFALSADGRLDGVFSVTLNNGSGNRTVTRLQLTNTPGGVWNTQGGDGYWSLGAATSVGGGLFNAANDSVNFAVVDGGSFKVFAADWQNAMYLNGVVFTLTANFADGSSASASTTINPVTLPVVTIAASSPNAAEGGAPGQFTVTRSGSTAVALTVSYAIGGTASNGADYQTLSGSVFIAAGLASASIDVIPVDDNIVEGSETVILTINPTAAYSLGASSSATVTIADDDLPLSNPTIALAFNGLIRDRVGQAEVSANPDGKLDGVFTATLNPGSGNRTVTRLYLANVAGGIWDTQAPDIYWTLGVAAGLDTALLNGADDGVNFPLTEGGSFKIFAADWQNAMFQNGVVFTLTANFSDGSSASASATIP